LVLLERPEKSLNLFQTVPHHWAPDRALVKQAAEHWDCIPSTLQELLRAVFWDGHRFRRFCERPSSLTDHHSEQNGNLIHTVEVVSTIKMLAMQFPQAHLGIALTAGFLHDAGKAAEYNPWKGGSWGMTNRGRLVGHRHTIIEWLAVALATNRIALPEQQYLSLLHAITAAPGAEWLGIRSPMTPESTLLSLADRLSGEKSLVAQLAQGQGGWGDKYPHKKGQPFTIAPEVQHLKQKTKQEIMAEF
jgi:3'-5' exoribonuclease